jgi:hypothetical protein
MFASDVSGKILCRQNADCQGVLARGNKKNPICRENQADLTRKILDYIDCCVTPEGA